MRGEALLRTGAMAALVAVAGFAVVYGLGRNTRRERARRGQLADQLQSWENEGGNLPEVQSASESRPLAGAENPDPPEGGAAWRDRNMP